MELMTIRSDRQVLTQTLLEVEALLQQPTSMTFLLSSFRARVRVLFLLQHLCRDHLSRQQQCQISESSRFLSEILREHPDHLQALDQEQT